MRVRGIEADQTSFDEFFLGTRTELTLQLTAMTRDPELARDVVQEAYARAWQRWSRVSPLDNPLARARTVAWRLAVSTSAGRRLPSAPSSCPNSSNGHRQADLVAVEASVIPSGQDQVMPPRRQPVGADRH